MTGRLAGSRCRVPCITSRQALISLSLMLKETSSVGRLQ
jgi:hypothetical protein